MIRDVVALVGNEVAAFELGIVSQVFGLDRSTEGLPTYRFDVVAAQPGPVPTTSGYAVDVRCGPERIAAADLITVPAWPQLESPAAPDLVEALRAAVDAGALVLSICSGAFLLAGAGLLDGRRAATHWQFADRLAGLHPQVTVDRDVLYVEDGAFLTSAGAAAGIDASLHVIRSHFGATVANSLARRMVVPAFRAGGQAQYVQAPLPERTGDGELAGLLDRILLRLDEPLTVDLLAAEALMSPRTFARKFRDSTGTTPHRWLLDQRMQRAEQLLETTDLTVDVVAERAGLGSGDTLRHHFAAQRGVSPATYRSTFRAAPFRHQPVRDAASAG